MRQEAATDFETIDLVECGIGSNGGELKNLVEGGVDARRLGIVEDERHRRLFLARSCVGDRKIADAEFERLPADPELLGQLVERPFVVDIEGFAFERRDEPRGRHQQFGGELIGLDLDLFRAERRSGVAVENGDAKFLVNVDLSGDQGTMQNEMRHFMRKRKALLSIDQGHREFAADLLPSRPTDTELRSCRDSELHRRTVGDIDMIAAVAITGSVAQRPFEAARKRSFRIHAKA